MGVATITLRTDEELLRRAEALAAQQNTTVAEMFERLLRVLTLPPVDPEELSPITARVAGILPPASDVDDRKAIEDEARRKHSE